MCSVSIFNTYKTSNFSSETFLENRFLDKLMLQRLVFFRNGKTFIIIIISDNVRFTILYVSLSVSDRLLGKNFLKKKKKKHTYDRQSSYRSRIWCLILIIVTQVNVTLWYHYYYPYLTRDSVSVVTYLWVRVVCRRSSKRDELISHYFFFSSLS